jgi:valyl-tRNA synthetase
MSKSLGNGIDPLEIIDRYGADALRFALASNNSPGNDMRFSDERIESARNFANKLWNASRFILMNLDIEKVTAPNEIPDLAIEDKWILSKFNSLVSEVSDNIDKYELGVALAKLYDFIWDLFCDWYIELVKPRLLDSECKNRLAAQNTLAYVFGGTLQLLHPFMPFITEEIWQKFPHEGESIMISKWPETVDSLSFKAEEESLKRILDVITAIRNRRSEMNVPASRKVPLFIQTAYQKDFEESTAFLTRLASANEISFEKNYDPENCVSIVTDSASVFIPLFELLDVEKEKERLAGEKAKTLSEIERIEKKLSNEQFVSKAPEKVVEAEREKLKGYQATLANIEATLISLNR